MIELILVLPIAGALWLVIVPRIARQLEARDLLDDLRPDPRDVADTERDLGVQILHGWEGEA